MIEAPPKDKTIFVLINLKYKSKKYKSSQYSLQTDYISYRSLGAIIVFVFIS